MMQDFGLIQALVFTALSEKWNMNHICPDFSHKKAQKSQWKQPSDPLLIHSLNHLGLKT